MITSISLSTIPFVSSTDTTRLQMSAKQLAQTLTHRNCKRPYVLNNNWPYLTNSSRLFRVQAKSNGEIIFANNDFMIVLYDETGEMVYYDTPRFRLTAKGFSTELRFKRDVGEFSKGEILYEYDCFNDNIPTFGYNLNTMFFPFFGFNFEDCIVISEHASNLMSTHKVDYITIPVYGTSIFKKLYPNSKYGILPEIGQEIDDRIIAMKVAINAPTGKDPKAELRSYNLETFAAINNSDTFDFKSEPIISKLRYAKVANIKVHYFGKKNSGLVLKPMRDSMELLMNDYRDRTLRPTVSDLMGVFGALPTGKELVQKIIEKYYYAKNAKNYFHTITNFQDLQYVIELELVKEIKTKPGDKLTNRHAAKGVASSLIIPNELRPFNTKTGKPIDVIYGPLTVFARQNFGQLIEGLLSKTIESCESEILKDSNPKKTATTLNKVAEIANILQTADYANEIKGLANILQENSNTHDGFIESVRSGGLFFEAPGFSRVNVKDLQDYIKREFDIEVNDSITIKKELFEYIQKELKLEIPVPKTDVVYPNIFNAPLYIMKLMYVAEGRLAVRDFGSYSPASKQPSRDRFSRSSHLGSMEFDACIAHNNIHTVREFQTVKSDCVDMKQEMLIALTSEKGTYQVPNYSSQSYVKKIIDAYITFLGEN